MHYSNKKSETFYLILKQQSINHLNIFIKSELFHFSAYIKELFMEDKILYCNDLTILVNNNMPK